MIVNQMLPQSLRAAGVEHTAHLAAEDVFGLCKKQNFDLTSELLGKMFRNVKLPVDVDAPSTECVAPVTSYSGRTGLSTDDRLGFRALGIPQTGHDTAKRKNCETT